MLAPGTLIATERGLIPIERLAGAREGPSHPLQRTLLANGLIIESSTGQHFMAATAGSREPSWVYQCDLKSGDRLLLDYKRYDPKLRLKVLFVGEDYGGWTPSGALVGDTRFWQMLGYTLANGSFPAERTSEDNFRCYAYDPRATLLLDEYEVLLSEHGIDYVRTEGTHAQLSVYHSPMQQWLRALGFRSLGEGARFVPSRVYQLPAWMREAMLAGVFTAWGEWYTHTRTKAVTPHVQIADKRLNQDILSLLWSVGIAAVTEQLGWERRGDIFVRDIKAFQERVGFLLPHQQMSVVRPPHSVGTWDTLHIQSTYTVGYLLQEHSEWLTLPAKQRNMLLRHRQADMGLRRQAALDAFVALDTEPPWWLRYHQARIDTFATESGAVLYELPSIMMPNFANFAFTR